jgi:hypothetical protein
VVYFHMVAGQHKVKSNLNQNNHSTDFFSRRNG